MPTGPSEICSFSNLPKKSCAHCRRPPSKHYELRQSSYLGNPIVEVLKNGGPIHSHDEHFRFGIEKALLMLGCLRVIEKFVDLGDEAVTLLPAETIETTASNIQVWVELKPDFIYGSGVKIDRPFLRMERLPLGTGPHIGIGHEKAVAILAVAGDLIAWLKSLLPNSG